MSQYKCVHSFLSSKNRSYNYGAKISAPEYHSLTVREQSCFLRCEDESSKAPDSSGSSSNMFGSFIPDASGSSSDYGSGFDSSSSDSSSSFDFGGGDTGGGGSSGDW